MNLSLITFAGILFLLMSAIGAYFSLHAGREKKGSSGTRRSQNGFQQADQWLLESQSKIEELILKMDGLLTTAQHELLDLRLEAGRLPQGLKNLKLTRENMNTRFQPRRLGKNLLETIKFFLREGDFRVGNNSIVFLVTPGGELPCLEIPLASSELPGDQMRIRLEQVAGAFGKGIDQEGPRGILYIGDDNYFLNCIKDTEWMEEIRRRNFQSVDYNGLIALLLSLRLNSDVTRLIRIFQQGIESTTGLVGQADKMGRVLASVSSDSLKIRTLLDGGEPGKFEN